MRKWVSPAGSRPIRHRCHFISNRPPAWRVCSSPAPSNKLVNTPILRYSEPCVPLHIFRCRSDRPKEWQTYHNCLVFIRTKRFQTASSKTLPRSTSHGGLAFKKYAVAYPTLRQSAQPHFTQAIGGYIKLPPYHEGWAMRFNRQPAWAPDDPR